MKKHCKKISTDILVPLFALFIIATFILIVLFAKGGDSDIFVVKKAVSSELPINPEHWIAEDESGEYLISMQGDTLDIVAPKGLTLWYDRCFTGEYKISYDICMPMDGCGYDRLSDLNCFWAAKDPQHPDNISARASERNGIFSKYNMLDLFYVGYGGNHNTTTRFRRYYGSMYGKSNDKVKPLIDEYTDSAYLLVPGKWYSIEIKVASDRTSFHVDGKKLFETAFDESPNAPTSDKGDAAQVGDGYFALRLLQNHVRLTGLTVRQ